MTRQALLPGIILPEPQPDSLMVSGTDAEPVTDTPHAGNAAPGLSLFSHAAKYSSAHTADGDTTGTDAADADNALLVQGPPPPPRPLLVLAGVEDLQARPTELVCPQHVLPTVDLCPPQDQPADDLPPWETDTTSREAAPPFAAHATPATQTSPATQAQAPVAAMTAPVIPEDAPADLDAALHKALEHVPMHPEATSGPLTAAVLSSLFVFEVAPTDDATSPNGMPAGVMPAGVMLNDASPTDIMSDDAMSADPMPTGAAAPPTPTLPGHTPVTPANTSPAVAPLNQAGNAAPVADISAGYPPPTGTGAMPEAAATPAHPVTVVGLGIGQPELSPAHLSVIASADVLAGGRRQLERFSHLPVLREVLASPLGPVMDALAAHHAAGRRVVVLADGDPLFFGIGALLARRFEGPSLRILPGTSSVQEAAARAAIPWQDITAVSLHGRNDWSPLMTAVLGGTPVCLLTDGTNTPDLVARILLDRGVDWYRMSVFENMGTQQEQQHDLRLTEAAATAFGPCCTVLLRPDGTPRGPRTGLPDDAFATEKGLITKWPIRAVALSALRLQPHNMVWDIGSGSGAVAMEAAALVQRGRVFAVEREPSRVVCMEENRRRFGAANVEIFLGPAPDVFESLPLPDRIFIGGGLGGRDGDDEVLNAACELLLPGGRIVVSCVLLGSLDRARDFFVRLGWEAEITCVQAATSAPLAGDLRLGALNPVFLVAATKPDGRTTL